MGIVHPDGYVSGRRCGYVGEICCGDIFNEEYAAPVVHHGDIAHIEFVHIPHTIIDVRISRTPIPVPAIDPHRGYVRHVHADSAVGNRDPIP